MHRHIRVVRVSLLIGVLGLPSGILAQASPKVTQATRLAAAPRIDGRLDDAGWRGLTPINDFTQQQPLPGAAPSERTEVFLAYDDEALYVGARMYRTRPSEIARSMSRRDGQGNAERLALTLDPQLDRRTAVAFGISAAGVRSDYRHTIDEDMRGRESQFDPVWSAAAVIDSLGWTAEMRIPFSQLRFPAAAEQRWGLQIDRWMPDKNEDLQWVMIPPDETGYVSRFGTLRGIDGVRSLRPVEVLPYIAGDATRPAATSVEDPLAVPYTARVGLDAKTAIGNSLTLDLTVNPDFGQIEADPAEVNLSAFETFFDERRPFFTEGSEILRGNGAQAFYPRRIGAAPRVSVEGDFVNAPRSSTILGAAKLTGRLPSRLTVGVLAAMTAAERARVFEIDSAFISSLPVEPRTAYGVVRLQQEVGRQASTVGLSLTATGRDLGGDSAIASRLTREAYFAGADWRMRFHEGRYAITGFVGGSHVAGDTAAIARLQTSSAHYFQRPDLSHITYDPLRRSLTGYTAMLRADKDAGRRFLWGMEVKAESPGFEINDVGRMQSTDDIEYNADLQVRETLPGRFLQNWRLGFDTRGARNFGGVHLSNSWSQNTSVTFKNYWNLNLRTSFELPTTDDGLTRGGPLMGRLAERRQEFRLNSRMGARNFWRVNAAREKDALGEMRRNAGGQTTVRPSDRLSLSIEPSWQQGTEPRQYVTRISGGTRTYGERYVFAHVDRTTISTKLRVNYTFTPDLTLEVYGEPFAANGRYSHFGELEAAGSHRLREYGTDGTTIAVDSVGEWIAVDGADSLFLGNRDFRVLSFRSNLVLRWEWAPGSTLFLVWQQNRRASSALGDDVRFGELLETTRAGGDNFFSVKASYWLPALFSRRGG